MSRSTPPPRHRRSSLTPLVVAAACVALMMPATVAATSHAVRQQTAPASNAPGVPKLTVLYPNDADVKYFAAMSANGAHVYLGSATDLVNGGAADESSQPWDVIPYTATRVFSPEQPGFIGLSHVSPDGRSFIVYSSNDLSGVSDPGTYDLFLIHDGVAKLASPGTASDVQTARWLADDGSRMIFSSDDDIAGTGDSNGVRDLYLYTASTNHVSLVNPAIANAVNLRVSPDGQHILVVDFNGDGTNAYEDIGGVSKLRSTGTMTGFSADSSKVFFTTIQSLAAGDTDGNLLDGYYSDSAGDMHLMNLNLDGLTGPDAPKTLRLSPDGTHWLLSTDASLVPADTDGTTDWYVGSAGGWTLIPGGLGTPSQLFTTDDDSVIVWASPDPAVAGDTDGTTDIYRWSAANPGTTDLLTSGAVSGTSLIRGLSSDGSRVVFSTDESLLPGDGDAAIDLYRQEGSSLTLLTPSTPHDVTFKAASTNGMRVAFTSVDPIVAADTHASDEDVYLSDEDTTAPTATVSTPPSGGGSTADLTLGSTDGSAVFFSCTLDGNPRACGPSTHLTGLSAGSHTFAVTAYDAAWNKSGVVSRTWSTTTDLTKPTATAPKWTFRTGISLSSTRPVIRLTWTAADTGGSGLASYDVEQRTDAGSYVRIASGITARTFDRAIAGGHTYRFRVRARDNAGNVGDWVYGLSFRLTAVGQSNSAVRYGPTSSRWRLASSSLYWGGTAKYATRSGSTASYTFTGRSFSWVSLKGLTRGKANVYVNGVLKATVDLRATVTLKQAMVWQTSWTTSARRTVMIKVLGTSGRPRVDVDGFFFGT